jgi:hypothetical protein
MRVRKKDDIKKYVYFDPKIKRGISQLMVLSRM